MQPFKEKVDDKAAKAANSGEYGKATKVGAETKDFAGASSEAVVDKKEVIGITTLEQISVLIQLECTKNQRAPGALK